MKKLFLLFISILSHQFISAQTVSTQFGQVAGNTVGGIKQFLGIPYAKPPVGNLRWKAPQTPDVWTSPLTTMAFPPECPQKKYAPDGTSSIVGDEDCLYLNVWTSQISSSANLPVMVFIHGGGNQQGSTSEITGGTPMYHGKNLAERGDVVVVTIQYRLGPLGFLVHPGLEPETANNTSGNYAAMDQILALQWVKNNISNFGGNPDNVTIFGESAGAVNVGNLLTSPLASGLFHRAIIQSGAPAIGPYITLRNQGISFVQNYTTVGTDVDKIAFMRTVLADSLVKSEEAPLSGGVVGMNWASTVDNIVFTGFPNAIFQSGNFNHVPLIIGSTKDEMSISAPPTVTPAMMNLLITSTIPLALQAEAMSLYPPGTTNAVAKDSYIRFLTDKQFTSTTRRTAECISKNQNEPVFRYLFTQKHSLALLEPYGSYHGMELFYVFNNWENTTGGQGALFSTGDDSTQNVCLDYWTNFASAGNPNALQLPTWPIYNSTTDCYLELKASPNGNQCGLRTAESNFWDEVIGFTGCTAMADLNEIDINANLLLILPNPSNDFIEFYFQEALKDYQIQIYSLDGQLVSQTFNHSKVDLSKLKSGTYITKTIVGGAVYSVNKFIKMD